MNRKHGGKRKGAGRKPAPIKMVSFRISVTPQTHQWFTDEATRRGQSVSSLYAEAATGYSIAPNPAASRARNGTR